MHAPRSAHPQVSAPGAKSLDADVCGHAKGASAWLTESYARLPRPPPRKAQTLHGAALGFDEVSVRTVTSSALWGLAGWVSVRCDDAALTEAGRWSVFSVCHDRLRVRSEKQRVALPGKFGDRGSRCGTRSNFIKMKRQRRDMCTVFCRYY